MAQGKDLFNSQKSAKLCATCSRVTDKFNSCDVCDANVCVSCFHHTLRLCKNCLGKQYDKRGGTVL